MLAPVVVGPPIGSGTIMQSSNLVIRTENKSSLESIVASSLLDMNRRSNNSASPSANDKLKSQLRRQLMHIQKKIHKAATAELEYLNRARRARKRVKVAMCLYNILGNKATMSRGRKHLSIDNFRGVCQSTKKQLHRTVREQRISMDKSRQVRNMREQMMSRCAKVERALKKLGESDGNRALPPVPVSHVRTIDLTA